MRNASLSSLLLVALVLALPAQGWCQFSPAPVSATTIPADRLIQPADLAAMLHAGTPGPVILQVGSHVFFAEARIPGAQYAGPGSQPAGLALLEKTVASLPKDRLILLYCGCCPWNRCPNVGPAYKRLRELGFTSVKVLYLANNFGDDWVAKDYPTDRGK